MQGNPNNAMKQKKTYTEGETREKESTFKISERIIQRTMEVRRKPTERAQRQPQIYIYFICVYIYIYTHM